MAWTVKVQTEVGASVEHDFDVPFDSVPHGTQFPISNSIARYYDTILNPPQLETFVSEWDKAAATPEFAHLRAFRLLRDAADSAARRQLYMRFVGD
jgi:hypothetical protein